MPEPLTISEAAPPIRSGELTPSELLEQCLARIDRYEDRVRAWVVVDRDGAREQAARLTAEAKAGRYRGPLHGIPVGIKDIIDVFDLPTGCGSKLWANSYARRDATCVQRLRDAGAVIVGKTVTTAYASFDPPPTRNPWNLDRTPGGSSSGSAAAVACGMCLAALATQTGGSITRPASYCGVASLKPTYGRVSVDGVLPLARSLDHVGVMANAVWDLAAVFEVIAGGDPDYYHGDFVEDPTPACLSVIDLIPDPFRLLRFGGLFEPAEGEFRRVYEAAAGRIGGLTPLETVVPPAGFNDVPDVHRGLMAIQAAQFHRDRKSRHPEDYPPEVSRLIDDGLAADAMAYGTAIALQQSLRQRVRRQQEPNTHLLTPAATGFAPPAVSTGDASFNVPWSFLGMPTVSIPAGWSADGLPMAVQVVGRHGREDDLFRKAAWAEKKLAFERRPVPL